LGYKREAKIVRRDVDWGERTKCCWILFRAFSSIGSVELEKLRLFRGTPVCSRQAPIPQTTTIGVTSPTVGANRVL
jgi:hypothetical protein